MAPSLRLTLTGTLVVGAAAFTRPLMASRSRVRTSAPSTQTMATKDPEYALLFDCDGVIVETEELHRLAYNGAFEDFGLQIDGKQVEWTVEYYDKLQNTVGGGKPKMNYHFTETTKGVWPVVTKEGYNEKNAGRVKLVDDLQDKKTEIYKRIVSEAAEARPGVLALMDAAIEADDIAVGICSASTRAGFEKVVDSIVGKERLDKLDVIIAGDDVTAKKPDPMIYNLAAKRLGLDAQKCVVIEDSLVGLRAAKGAGMKCLVTYTASTAAEDFYGEGADAKVPDLTANGVVTLDAIFGPLKKGSDELIESIRDSSAGAGVGSSASMSKADVDAYIAKVKAGVDFVAKAREARNKPLTKEQIAAYGDFAPYSDRSAGISKEEADAYIAKVKAGVDAVAAARVAAAEEQAATIGVVSDAAPKEMPAVKDTTEDVDWGVIGGTDPMLALRKKLLSMKYAPMR